MYRKGATSPTQFAWDFPAYCAESCFGKPLNPPRTDASVLPPLCTSAKWEEKTNTQFRIQWPLALFIKAVTVRHKVVKLGLLPFGMEPQGQQGPLCSPGWPSTCSVARAVLTLLSCLYPRSAKITGVLQPSRGGEELDLRLGSG